MAPPDTNIEKQKRRHRGPVLGLALGSIFVLALLIYWVFLLPEQGDQPVPLDAETSGAAAESTAQ